MSTSLKQHQISGKFLKDGAGILAKPIIELCNLSMKLGETST